jgi:hypothetical protein
MRTITTTKTVYKFDELSEEAKSNAAENLYDINVDYEWWQFIEYDAEQVGIKINGFDIDRGSYCDIELKYSAYEIATMIMREHGEECDTWMTAKRFIDDWNDLVAKYSDGKDLEKVTEDNEYDFDNDADDLEHDFRVTLEGCYLHMLREQYEYTTSEEAIIETIECNEYEFTEDGKLA